MIVKVRFSTYSTRWKELGAEDYARLRQAMPDLPEVKKDDYQQYAADMDAIVLIAHLGLDVDLRPLDPACSTMIVKLQDRIAALGLRGASDVALAAAGASVQIHVPDGPLMYVDEVKHLDDACTDELQTHLEEGWRILAVCPPNAQRRPDYILGRRQQGGTRQELTTRDLAGVAENLQLLRDLVASRLPSAAAPPEAPVAAAPAPVALAEVDDEMPF